VTPHDARRVALGVLAAALRSQKGVVREARAEHGRTSREAKRAVARLDELREAYNAISSAQSSERFASSMLSTLVREYDEGDDAAFASTVSIVRGFVERAPVECGVDVDVGG
jgi:succinate dehydrogenase/fumarate reductase flavoprotein subunit